MEPGGAILTTVSRSIQPTPPGRADISHITEKELKAAMDVDPPCAHGEQGCARAMGSEKKNTKPRSCSPRRDCRPNLAKSCAGVVFAISEPERWHLRGTAKIVTNRHRAGITLTPEGGQEMTSEPRSCAPRRDCRPNLAKSCAGVVFTISEPERWHLRGTAKISTRPLGLSACSTSTIQRWGPVAKARDRQWCPS